MALRIAVEKEMVRWDISKNEMDCKGAKAREIEYRSVDLTME